MMTSEELFHDLCENAYDLIQSVDPDGRFLYVNAAWLKTLGYAREEVPGLKLFDIIHPDSHQHCRLLIEKLREGKPAVDIAAEFVSKTGDRIAVEGSASCRMEGGKVVATRAIFRNVSRRKRIEEELSRHFELSLDLLCIAGLDGFFKQVNPAFMSTLGYTREELLSRSFLDFVHPDDRRKTIREIENLTKGLPVVDFQNRYRTKDDRYLWLAWRAAPLTGRGMVYAIARDITQTIEDREIRARQSAELARSNAELEQFAYVASHDLRAPLRNIGDLAEWIEEEIGDSGNEKIAGYLEQLRNRVRRMESLTEDLLAYSRVGREEEEAVELDTGTLVRDLAFLLAPPEGFRIDVHSGMPTVRAARAPLEQVFRNLIANAIKHHDRPDGRIDVRAAKRGRFWEFTVKDDGPGIPEEFQERIFLMFQKLKSHDEVEGSGMGLALVKRIIESRGGRISVASGPGRGTSFVFTWPGKEGA